MLNSDCVEWFETVNDTKCLTAFLEDCKPSQSIGRVRRLIYSGVDFDVNKSAHFIINPRWDRHVLKNPGLVFNDGHDDQREEVFSKATTL